MDAPQQPPLRLLSQLNFRLSQRPPSAQRALCTQLSRTDSIEDDPPSEGAAGGPSIEDYASSDGDDAAAATGRATQWTASSPILTLGSTASTAWGTPAERRPEPSLRTISRHQQHISPQSTPAGRPLLSQRPAQWSTVLPGRCSDQTPSKRPRRVGAAAGELMVAAAREVSDFRIWHHCLSSSSSDAQLVCHQPTPGARLRLVAAQSALGTHLFSAQATVMDVFADDARLAGAAGRPLAVLLSFAVVQDAAPHAAAQMAARIEALARGAGDAVVLAVHQPWRIQGEGDQLCLLASRFVVE